MIDCDRDGHHWIERERRDAFPGAPENATHFCPDCALYAVECDTCGQSGAVLGEGDSAVDCPDCSGYGLLGVNGESLTTPAYLFACPKCHRPSSKSEPVVGYVFA
ncbi:hypothetical protein RM704_44870, partial [Streptomyces sp. DSM 3412]